MKIMKKRIMVVMMMIIRVLCADTKVVVLIFTLSGTRELCHFQDLRKKVTQLLS
jgi:hypothetical protein